MSLHTGLDVLLADEFRALAGQRVGLMTNPSAVDAQLVSAYRRFADAHHAGAVTLTALYGPEHGFSATAADGAHVASTTDARTGLPVFSLYGAALRPTAAMLEPVDVLVCDIQDIGVRYYTYLWTVSHILEAAGEHGTPVVILDRPNPLGGERRAGPVLDPALSSLVGRFPVPVQHGLTLGEMAALINATWNATPADLTVIACEGWQRADTWAATGRPWVPPSPSMAQLSTLAHYPGACLLEGTNLSEGRGTALPFEIVGAPWINAPYLVDYLHDSGWGEAVGAHARPHSFAPATSKWAGETCGGVQVHITDPARWQPIRAWLGVLLAIRRLYPDQFAWLPPDPASGIQHFDRLIGDAALRPQLDAYATAPDRLLPDLIAELTATWPAAIRAFDAVRAPFLRYA